MFFVGFIWFVDLYMSHWSRGPLGFRIYWFSGLFKAQTRFNITIKQMENLSLYNIKSLKKKSWDYPQQIQVKGEHRKSEKR